MPVSIQADESQIESAKRLYDGLLASSVEIGWTPNRILLRKVPALFRHFPWAECMHALLSCQSKSDLDVREHLLNVLINENNTYSNLSVQQLWSKFVTNHTDIATTLGDIGKPIPLSNWLNLDE
jgi:DNA mismatch repair protein MutL